MWAFKFIRGSIGILLLSWLWHLLQAPTAAPVLADAPLAPAPLPTLATIPTPAWPPAPIRVEWFSQCDPARAELGLYAATDGACTPSRTADLDWLQAELTQAGGLTPGETLMHAAQPNLPGCAVQIQRSGETTGWLCSDRYGIFRQERPTERWQLQPDGTWVVHF